MSGVDDRIVAMKFDNTQFEQKLQDTIRGLDKLRGSLSFDGASKGLNDLSAAGKNFDMGNMAGAVEGVSAKFLALTTIGITALATITSHAIQAGGRMVSALSLEPIMQGFQEFELKMGSIQTIMAGSGESLETVNATLAELNEYSDRTIYSFADMTQNIGKFTNAGVSLDDATAAIQGVANVAALSGANSNEAARSMYNFAQAISTGSVKLIDWKSIELANMGTVEFKQQLIDTGVAMGTLTETADGYITSAGTAMSATQGFNQSLTDEWLSADVLTTTLQRFSDETTDIGRRATAAATDVKTFSMMIDTMKESVGSGWATTFETVFGDFDEGRALWTGINDWFSETVGASAEARNDVLKGWKELGGRDVLLEGLKDAAGAFGAIFAPIKDAFREIFPKKTAEDLFNITQRFAEFAERIKIGGETADKIKSIFSGLFSIFEIGWTIVKELAGVIGELFSQFSGAGSGIFDFAATTGDTLTALNEALVAGGGIKDFFDGVRGFIQDPIKALEEFRDALKEAFEGTTFGEIMGNAADRLGERFDMLKDLGNGLSDAWDWLGDLFGRVTGVFTEIWDYINEWFSGLGDNMAAATEPGDFDKAVDVLSVGLLGGIGVILTRFMTNGLNLDFGGGLIENISEAFEGLTGTLEAMQANVRAEALMKIAAAVGILAASVVVLSMIDSADLAKALTALTVGFGQLMGSMELMNRMSMGTSGVKLTALAAGMILLSTAVLILSVAVRNLSGLGWEELAKGLLGVTVMLGAMAVAANMMSGIQGGLVRAGFAMIGISIALLILSQAVKQFSDLSWSELAKGLVGVAIGLGIFVGAMQLMPTQGILRAGVAMVPLAASMWILAQAVGEFSEFSWSEMAKGFAGVGAGLVIIAGAMHLMPSNLMLTAPGLLVVAGALYILSKSVESMGSLDIETLAKGIGGFAVMLGVLAVALNVMQGTIMGAAALVVAAGALLIFAHVIKEMGSLSIGELAMGIGAIAAVLVTLGLAALILTPVIPALFGLGIALGIIGGAFALFGVGAMAVAKAFEILAVAGRAGARAMIDIIDELLKALPGFASSIATAIIEGATEILEAGPALIRIVEGILRQLLDTVIALIPDIAEALSVFITEGLTLIREKIPEVVETGMAILIALLTGIRDNIGEIVTLVADIITNFLDALSEKVPEIIDSVYNFVMAVIEGVIAKLVDIGSVLLPKGVELLQGLMDGIASKATEVIDWFKALPGNAVVWIGDVLVTLLNKGIDLITGLLDGLIDKIPDVVTWFTELPGNILTWLGDVLQTLAGKGIDLIAGLLAGILQKIPEVISWLGGMPGRIVTAVGDLLSTLLSKGSDIVQGLWNGIKNKWETVAAWFQLFPGRIKNAIGNIANILFDIGKSIINGLWEGMKDVWEGAKDWLGGLGSSIVNLKGPPKRDKVLLVENGMLIMGGLRKGMNTEWDKIEKWLKGIDPAEHISDKAVDNLAKTFNDIVGQLGDLDDLNPVITPVLDLTQVQRASQGLDQLMAATISPDVSYRQARLISTTSEDQDAVAEPAYTGPTEVTFEQNIYSPTALSVNDIYRNTKSQIALAKEELSI